MKKRLMVRCIQMCIVLATLLLTEIKPVRADVRQQADNIMHAVGVLKGLYDDYTKKHAVAILQDAISTDTTGYVMNVLGLVYMDGVGVEKDAGKALHLLNEAGMHGCIEAYHNLGVLYKLGKCDMRQDFVKSYEAFAKGAELGSAVCKYDAGFMLYKGMGCTQNYAEAFQLFQSAAENGHSGAMYMLGLCYRNGYGTKQDEEKGMKLLNKSADLGYHYAMEELTRPNPENCMHDIYVSGDGFCDIPETMPTIQSDVNDTTLLNGHYEGFIVMYDWSGKHVLGERPAFMSINRAGNDAEGLMVLGNDTITFRADIMENGSLKFKKSYAKLNERYTFSGKANYSLSHSNLDIWNDKIRGDLSLYNIKHREPEKPMYMELYRRSSAGTNDNCTSEFYNHITIVPNPFSNQFEALFELSHSSTATVRIFDKFGKMVWHQNLGTLGEGRNQKTIFPNLLPGSYVLNIAAGQQTLRAIIVKNGGE